MPKATVAALLVLLAPAARAGDDHPWSFGFGLGVSTVQSLGSVQLGYPMVSTSAVVPEIGVERLLGPSTALLVNLSVDVTSASASGAQNFSPAVTSLNSVSAGVLVGVRRLLNGPDAPVLVSVIGGVAFGYATLSEDVTQIGGTGATVTLDPSAHQLAVGLRGALAVEKPLVDRLALRLTAHLLAVDYRTGKERPSSSTPSTSTSAFSAGLGLDPTLELRLAF